MYFTQNIQIVFIILILSIAAQPAIHAAPATKTTKTHNKLLWTPRSGWQAAPARYITPINSGANGGNGVPFVIIHHTATPECHSNVTCASILRAMQRTHQQDHGWDDIGYNFLIGGGGSKDIGGGKYANEFAEIYEGRGFNVSGAHAAPYNQRSVGIALIGNWSDVLPTRNMLDKLKQLISFGTEMGYIQGNYTLHGHRQVKATLCPGTHLFNEIKQWPHFKATFRNS